MVKTTHTYTFTIPVKDNYRTIIRELFFPKEIPEDYDQSMQEPYTSLMWESQVSTRLSHSLTIRRDGYGPFIVTYAVTDGIGGATECDIWHQLSQCCGTIDPQYRKFVEYHQYFTYHRNNEDAMTSIITERIRTRKFNTYADAHYQDECRVTCMGPASLINRPTPPMHNDVLIGSVPTRMMAGGGPAPDMFGYNHFGGPQMTRPDAAQTRIPIYAASIVYNGEFEPEKNCKDLNNLFFTGDMKLTPEDIIPKMGMQPQMDNCASRRIVWRQTLVQGMNELINQMEISVMTYMPSGTQFLTATFGIFANDPHCANTFSWKDLCIRGWCVRPTFDPIQLETGQVTHAINNNIVPCTTFKTLVRV